MKKCSPVAPGSVADEFEACEFHDARIHRRVMHSIPRLHASPAMSFPQALQDRASIEGFYRLVENDAVRLEHVLEGHIQATAQRAKDEDLINVLDWSEFHF